jgi:hypothetical protein
MNELFYSVMNIVVYVGLPVSVALAIVLDDLLGDRFLYGRNV